MGTQTFLIWAAYLYREFVIVSVWQSDLEMVVSGCYLNSAVEEAAVLPGLVQQAFGERERQHAPGLVGLLQASSGFFEHLHPSHGVRACN